MEVIVYSKEEENGRYERVKLSGREINISEGDDAVWCIFELNGISIEIREGK